jgi:hypothetical protein
MTEPSEQLTAWHGQLRATMLCKYVAAQDHQQAEALYDGMHAAGQTRELVAGLANLVVTALGEIADAHDGMTVEYLLDGLAARAGTGLVAQAEIDELTGEPQ